MNKTIIKGKRIRTNNATLQGVMELWQEIMSLQPQGELYAVYSNYESNYLGDYDLLIGTASNELPDSIELAQCEYLKIPVVSNNIEQVAAAWNKIWSNPEIEGKRAYATDYELYDTDGNVTIFLSMKS